MSGKKIVHFRMTAKYKAALACATKNGIEWGDNQEELYQAIGKIGLHWNSETGEWERFDDKPSDEPTNLVRIRVWAETERVQEVARQLKDALVSGCGFEMLDESEPYQCRPPKQLESRVYLTFKNGE